MKKSYFIQNQYSVYLVILKFPIQKKKNKNFPDNEETHLPEFGKYIKNLPTEFTIDHCIKVNYRDIYIYLYLNFQ